MDSEVDSKEAKHTVNFLSNFLAQFARENRIALVVSCSMHKDDRDALLRRFLTSRAQVVLKAERHGNYRATFALEKHPFKQQASRTIILPLSRVL
jgi:hypothetical protein